MNETTFNELKQTLLDRAKASGACTDGYAAGLRASDFHALCKVIKDNWFWLLNNKVLDADLIEKHKDDFAEESIYHNVNVKSGYLLASGSATVEAYDSATVRAYDSATVRAYGSATVEAYGSAYITSYSVKECKLSNQAIYRVRETNTVYYADEDMKFVKQR